MNAPTLTTEQLVFKNLIWTPLIMAGETYLFTAVPVLDGPILGDIDKELLSVVSDYIFNNLIVVFDLTQIKFVSAVNQAAYVKAQENILIVANDAGVGSDAFNQAIQAEAAALVNLVHFNPS